MAARLFDNRLSQEWMGFTVLRRLIVAIAVVHFSLAAVSGYRAVVQVYDASIELSSPMLGAGSTILARYVTSGRTYVDANIELIQGSHKEVLAEMVILENHGFFYDFRPRRATLSTEITPEVLSRFASGDALVRVIAVGHPQWLRTPPATIRQTAVKLVVTELDSTVTDSKRLKP